MLHEDRALLADLKRACNQAVQFALGYMDGNLSPEAENTYALLLIDIGERLLAHSKAKSRIVLDGSLVMQVNDEKLCTGDVRGARAIVGTSR
jgi:hypothetical protein